METNLIESESCSFMPLYSPVRTDSYVIIASLLREAPSESLLEILKNLAWDPGIPEIMDRALKALQEACSLHTPEALAGEFNRLFVGLGSGEVVPYASWYTDKKIQSFPLARLRSELLFLGIVKQGNNRETEDHAGALCEIMAILSRSPQQYPREVQSGFFQRHLAPWLGKFFEDLLAARSSQFYRTVALFGLNFLECERAHLQGGPADKGGR